MKCSSKRYIFQDGLPAESGFLEGHFPENPSVPGAILIGLAAQQLCRDGYEIESISRMKFLQTLHPLQPFEITVTPETTPSEMLWNSQGQTIAKAIVHLRPARD